MHPEAGRCVKMQPSAGRVRRSAAVIAGLLFLTACGPGEPPGTTAPSDATSTTSPSSATASPSADATATPQKVFTDQELMAISNKVLEPHGGRVGDTAMARKSYALMTQPRASASPSSILGPTEPAECNVFHRSWQHEAQLDPSMGFAVAEIFDVGAHGTGMILFDVRSAPRERLAKADFDYSQELMVRCATFDQTVSGATGPQKMTIQLLPGPDIGEKAYVTKESFGGNATGVGLRVLAGTVSLDMGANTGMAISAEEALNLMSQVAKEFVDEVENSL